MALKVGELYSELGIRMEGFRQGLKQARNNLEQFDTQTKTKFSRLSNVLKKSMFAVGTAASIGFTTVATGAIRGASKLEGYRNTLNVVLKDQKKAAETMAWAVKFANQTPFETDSIVEATVRLESYGLKAKEVMKDIGDMAGVMGKDIMQAVEAIADAQTGELERLKEFGITKDMIAEYGKNMGLGELVNNKNQITDMEKFNQALFALMRERFEGGMEIQAKSFKGLMSTVTGVFKTTLATMAGISAEGEIVAGGLFDTIKSKIQQVVDNLNKWQEDGTLQRWTENVQKAFTKAWNIISQTVELIIEFGQQIKEHWGIIEPLLAGLISGLVALKTGFLALEVTKKIIAGINMAMAILNGTMSINPVYAIAIAIGVLVAAGVALYKNWGTISVKAKELWNNIKISVNNTVENIKESINGFILAITTKWNTLKSRASEIWNNVKNTVVGAFKWMYDHNYYFEGLVNFIRDSWVWITTTTKEIWYGIKDFLSTNWNEISTNASNTWDYIYNNIKKVWTIVRDWLSKLWNQLTDEVNEVWTNISNIIGGILDGIKEKFMDIVNAAWDWGHNLVSNFISGIRRAIDNLKETAGKVASTISDFLGFHSPTKKGPGSMADKWAPNFIDMYVEGIKKGIPKIQAAVNNMALTLKPTIAQPAVPTVSNNYGGNVFQIYLQSGSSREQADELLRELRRRGVKFNG